MVPWLLPAPLRGKGLSAPRQLLGGQRQAQIILADIDEVGGALDKPHRNEDIGENADPHPGITFFEARDSAGGGTRAGREIGHGYPAPQARATNVVAEPFKGSSRLRGTHSN